MKNQSVPSDKLIRSIIHTPAEAAQLTQNMVKKLHNTPGGGISWGLPEIDAVMRPARPGDLVTVLGAPSQLKSFIMNYLAYEEATKIMARQNDKQLVIKITWEQSVEEDTLSWIAKESQIPVNSMIRGQMTGPEWKILEKTGVDRTLTPIWVVGHSLERAIAERIARPRMTMTDAWAALDMIINKMTSNRLEPCMIVLDYLQRIRPDPQSGFDRREQVMEIVNLCKDAAIAFGCPVYLGVQKGRDKNAKGEDHIPTIDSGQETSNIEQSSDQMYGVWYPLKTEVFGSLVYGVKVDPTLAVVRGLKQKIGGSAPHTFALKIDPARNQILGAKKVA